MVEEYISREAAIAVLCDACGNAACPKGMIPRCSYYEKMKSSPAADVRPVVHGVWQDEDAETPWWHIRCSECGHARSMMSTQGEYPNYCEKCGATMREG